MKLDKIWIAEFKNLRDVTIDFDESNLMTILVGWNGAGKSNVMEALVLAFRNLDLGVRPEFSYELKYQIKGHIVTVKATKEDNKSTAGQYNITVVPLDAEKGSQPPQEISINKFKRSEGGTFLPTHAFVTIQDQAADSKSIFNSIKRSFETICSIGAKRWRNLFGHFSMRGLSTVNLFFLVFFWAMI